MGVTRRAVPVVNLLSNYHFLSACCVQQEGTPKNKGWLRNEKSATKRAGSLCFSLSGGGGGVNTWDVWWQYLPEPKALPPLKWK